MRILILGGTRFVGRNIAQTALARGHDVTLFNRGRSDPDALPNASHLIGHRDKDLSALADGTYDATIDVSAYVPSQVRNALAALGDRAGHFTVISTVSVYSADIPTRGFTEDSPLLPAEWDEAYDVAKYGGLKVGCEIAASEDAPAGALVIRPGYVVGPRDNTERFTHWVRVVAAGEPFVGPDPEQPLQCVDARDLAAFTITAIERGTAGPFTVTAPQQPPTFSQVLDTVAAALDVTLPEVTWSKASQDLPLSSPRSGWPLMHADVSKAVDAGFTWRPLAQTIRDIADHEAL